MRASGAVSGQWLGPGCGGDGCGVRLRLVHPRAVVDASQQRPLQTEAPYGAVPADLPGFRCAVERGVSGAGREEQFRIGATHAASCCQLIGSPVPAHRSLSEDGGCGRLS